MLLYRTIERTCGRRANTRIIDGLPAQDGEFPWMVKLTIAFEFSDPNARFPIGETYGKVGTENI